MITRPAVSRAGERGTASAELVLATPLLLLMLLLIVQFGVWAHASHIAQAAATQALAATRVQGGSTADGQGAARRVLGQLGTGLLLHPRVTVRRGGDAAHVRVAGTAQQVVPGLHLPVRADARGPIEKFRPPRPGR